MKKTILFLAAIISIQSCKKMSQDVEPLAKSIASAVIESITSTSANSSFLYIPEDEGGWSTGRMGLLNTTQTVSHTTVNSYLNEQYNGAIAVGTPVKMITYPCLIANGIPGDTWDTTENNPITRAGIRDFAVNNDGSQSVPVQINVYVNGNVFVGRKKDEFDYSPTNKRFGACDGIRYSGKDYTWWGWGDMYYNSAIVPNTDTTTYAVIAVTLNYKNISPINPPVSLLPVRIEGNSSVVDTTAIYKNAANPATNYKATIQHGKVKGVSITWEGNGYAYCISRDGQMILKWYDGRSFFDPLGTKNSQYRIITRAQGRIPDDSTAIFKPSR